MLNLLNKIRIFINWLICFGGGLEDILFIKLKKIYLLVRILEEFKSLEVENFYFFFGIYSKLEEVLFYFYNDLSLNLWFLKNLLESWCYRVKFWF